MNSFDPRLAISMPSPEPSHTTRRVPKIKSRRALYLQYHLCPDADERCSMGFVAQFTPSIYSNRQLRTVNWVVFKCRYVILFRSHLSSASRSSYTLLRSVFLRAQCQTANRRQFYSSHPGIYNDYTQRHYRRFHTFDMIHKSLLGCCPELLAPL
jgi:hypothetical protein